MAKFFKSLSFDTKTLYFFGRYSFLLTLFLYGLGLLLRFINLDSEFRSYLEVFSNLFYLTLSLGHHGHHPLQSETNFGLVTSLIGIGLIISSIVFFSGEDELTQINFGTVTGISSLGLYLILLSNPFLNVLHLD